MIIHPVWYVVIKVQRLYYSFITELLSSSEELHVTPHYIHYIVAIQHRGSHQGPNYYYYHTHYIITTTTTTTTSLQYPFNMSVPPNMSNEKALHQSLSADIESKEVFEQAKQFAYEYMDANATAPAYPSDASLAGLDAFREPLPSDPLAGLDVLAMLHTFGAPGAVRHAHRYFGFVNGGVIPVAAASRWMSDVWDQNCALYATSPVSATLEQVVEGWITDLLGLPQDTAMGLVGGSSVATMCAMAAARTALLAKQGWDVDADGLFGAPPMRVVLSDQAHGSVQKALALLGLGRRRVELVPTDDQGRMIIDQIPALDAHTLIILSAGNVCTGSFDFIDEICDIAIAAGAWVHVDGAFGLWASACPSLSHLTKGIEKADSWCADAHKTLNAPYDCGLVLCKHRATLMAAMLQSGSYLQEAGTQRDSMYYTPDMSRRARSVDLWVTLKHLGRRGVVSLVEGLVARSKEFGEQLRKAQFIVLNDVVFNQCIFRCESDEATASTLANIQGSGVMWCGGASWLSRKAVRISCCSWGTTAEDISACVEVCIRARVSL
jgi:glutamate/tyrosine decarboxylase-like PLP-dependent enzyme